MAKIGAVLKKMREICLSLPDTKETLTWEKPHFRVGEKIFAGCSEQDGKPTIGFKLEKQHQAIVIEHPDFSKAPYVGQHGWVSLDASNVKDWNDVREMLLESYRLIAPKRLWAQVESGEGEQPVKWTKKKAATKKSAKKKTTAKKKKTRKR